MKSKRIPAVVTMAVVLAVFGGPCRHRAGQVRRASAGWARVL